MTGFKNFLEFIIENWMLIVSAIIVISAGVIKLKDFFSKSNEEKFELAQKQIKETILWYCSTAEFDLDNFVKAGSIKRSKVIQQLYIQYPVLSTVANQEEVIAFIDEAIDDALKTLRKVIEENENSFVITTKEVK